MFIVFYSTSNVFKAEEILNGAGINCSVVPTPVQDKAYCGVCIRVEDESATILVSDLEHKIIR